MEMICAIVHQLTRDLTEEQIKNSPFATYYVDHTTGLYPVAASGVPFTASYFQSKYLSTGRFRRTLYSGVFPM